MIIVVLSTKHAAEPRSRLSPIEKMVLAEKFLWSVTTYRTVVILFFFHFSSVGAYPIQFSEIGLSFSNPVRLCLPVLYFAKFFLEIMVSDHQFGCANFHLICDISYYHLIGYFYAKKTITSLGTTAGAAVTMCSSE